MAAADHLSPGQFEDKHRNLSHWGALAEGDKVIGLNGSIASNVQHHGHYTYPTDRGHDSRKITTFDYNHPTDPLWQNQKYKTPSGAPGPSVYRRKKK